MDKRIILAILVLYVAFMAYGALSTDIGKALPDGLDKVLHLVEFFVLAILLLVTFTSFGMSRIWTFAAVFFISLALGFLSEVIQKIFTTTRTFSWLDFLADAAGISLALLSMAVHEWMSSRQSR
jgi:VanZ family protein